MYAHAEQYNTPTTFYNVIYHILSLIHSTLLTANMIPSRTKSPSVSDNWHSHFYNGLPTDLHCH